MLAVVVGAIVWVNLSNADSKYGPIRAGTFGGEYSHTHLADGPPGTTYITGPAGTEVVRMYSLANDGSHSVKITSISASASGEPHPMVTVASAARRLVLRARGARAQPARHRAPERRDPAAGDHPQAGAAATVTTASRRS